MKEVSRQCSKGAVEEVESVENNDVREPKGARTIDSRTLNLLEKGARGNESLLQFWEMYCVSAIPEREVPDRRTQVGSP